MENFKARIRRAARLKRLPEQHIEILAVISEALGNQGITPVVVGGAAVELYTQASYQTTDLALVGPASRELAHTMRGLGFVKRGKDWQCDHLETAVEFWSDHLGPDETEQSVRFGRRELRLISVEDLIIDRLCAFKWWGSTLDGVNVLLVMRAQPGYDERATVRKAKREDVYDGLVGVKRISRLLASDRVDESQALELLTGLHGSFVR